MKANRLKSKKGQNTAEYMLLLLLIGGGSIVAFKTFGKGIINRFASVTSIVTGGEKVDASGVQGIAKGQANADVDFKTFDDPDAKAKK
jgi:Flp pilus assembly pilin Flp